MLRRLISASCATSILLLGAPSVRAAPPTGEVDEAPSDPESDARERVDQAIEAWRNGEWTEVRDLLEPLVRDRDGIEDKLLRESALRYLAEATLLDEGLEYSERNELARGYIERLLDSASDWAPPSGLHGRAFYDLVAKIRSDREAERAENCRGELVTCEADFAVLQKDHQDLQTSYNAQEIAVTEVTKRNRGLALLPLGIGHFANDNYALGGTFLALEVATGAAGLGLLIYRSRGLGCVRTNGFAPKSLVCSFDDEEEENLPRLQDHVENVRNAEIVMGYLFLGSIIVDIAIAQVLFKPFTVVDKGMKTRRELESESQPEGTRRKPKAKLQIRPHPAYFPGGIGFGVTLQL